MIVVLTCAGGFVYWRVQVALDRTLDGELGGQVTDLRQALQLNLDRPAAALSERPTSAVPAQVVSPLGRVLAGTLPTAGISLVDRRRLAAAARGEVRYDLGRLLLDGRRRLRVAAFPVGVDQSGQQLIAMTAVRLGQRDEALRELLAQLTIANLAALAVASLVGDRLARAALIPVERYRARAEEITAGATDVRLDVPLGVDDEVSRLGHTLNRMLTTQESVATAQRQFLADASHELRTPLSVLTGEVELALRRPRTVAELEATLRNVAGDTARLVRLADQLLALEAAQGAPPEVGVTDVRAAMARVVRGTRARPEPTQRVVEAPELPNALLVRLADPLLDRVLGNLVENALLHGRGAVRLTAGPCNGPGRADLVRIDVTDEGPGMPRDFVAAAVGRFRRADAARATPGSGLGLSLVHAIVSHAGGELRACSGTDHHSYSPVRFAGVPCAPHHGRTAISVLLPAG